MPHLLWFETSGLFCGFISSDFIILIYNRNGVPKTLSYPNSLRLQIMGFVTNCLESKCRRNHSESYWYGSNLNPKVLPKEIVTYKPLSSKETYLNFLLFSFIMFLENRNKSPEFHSTFLRLTRCDLDFTPTKIIVFTSFGKQKRLA